MQNKKIDKRKKENKKIEEIEIKGHTYKVTKKLQKKTTKEIIEGIQNGELCIIDGFVRKTKQYSEDGKIKQVITNGHGFKKIPIDIENYIIPYGWEPLTYRNLNAGMLNGRHEVTTPKGGGLSKIEMEAIKKYKKEHEKEIERRKNIEIKPIYNNKKSLDWYLEHKKELLQNEELKQNAINRYQKYKYIHNTRRYLGEDEVSMQAHMNVLENKDNIGYENRTILR